MIRNRSADAKHTMGQPSKPNLTRRNLLQLSTGFITTQAILGTPIALAAPQLTSQLTPDRALDRLLTGNQRFVKHKQLNPHQNILRLTEVAQSQVPFAAILGCADSRVVPEIVFDQGIGDLFVVRVAGNIATVEDTASEEYALAFLNTPLIMVLGHERCGAVTAALKGGLMPGSISSLVTAIAPAIKASENEPGDRLTNAVKANVRLQVQRLEKSLLISEAITAGKLKVIGAYYDLDSGEVSLVV
jgi:carbonic anhydrase